jgi:acetyl-CoA C-acetyltransferase
MSEVAITSYALKGFEDEINSRGSDYVFEVARTALDRAGLTRDDVDTVVGCDLDGFSGVTVSFGMKACAAGGYKKPSYRMQNGGVPTIQLARAKIKAGKADCVMIATEDNIKLDEEAVTNISHDPLYDRPMSQNHLIAYGLLADYYRDTCDVNERDYAAVAAKNYRAGADNPWANESGPRTVEEVMDNERVVGPLRESQMCGTAAGGGAVVLISDKLAREIDTEPVWIDGAGLGSSLYTIREMDDLLKQPSLREACRTAYEQAGVKEPRSELDLAEVFDPATPLELLGYEALEFCMEGAGADLIREGVTETDGELPVNPSGGAMVTNPLNTGGLYRTIQAASVLVDDHPSISMPDAEKAAVTGGDVMLGTGGRTDGVLVLRRGAS